VCQRLKGVEFVGFIGVGGESALADADGLMRHCVDTMSTQCWCCAQVSKQAITPNSHTLHFCSRYISATRTSLAATTSSKGQKFDRKTPPWHSNNECFRSFNGNWDISKDLHDYSILGTWMRVFALQRACECSFMIVRVIPLHKGRFTNC